MIKKFKSKSNKSNSFILSKDLTIHNRFKSYKCKLYGSEIFLLKCLRLWVLLVASMIWIKKNMWAIYCKNTNSCFTDMQPLNMIPIIWYNITAPQHSSGAGGLGAKCEKNQCFENRNFCFIVNVNTVICTCL